MSQIEPFEPELLLELVKRGEVDLLKGKELEQFSTEKACSEFFGEYTLRLIGVEMTHMFDDVRFLKYTDKQTEIFKVWRTQKLTIPTSDSDDAKCFMCYGIWTVVREDNKEWSYKNTEYEKSCKDKKPCAYLPISVPEKKVVRFLEKFPELVIGLERYNEAVKYIRECNSANFF